VAQRLEIEAAASPIADINVFCLIWGGHRRQFGLVITHRYLSDSGVAIRKIGFSSRFSMELDSGGLLQLLSRMKEEHARSAAAIEALDRSAAESSRRLEHQRETIDRMGEDVNQIVAKTLQSAGSARQVSEVRPLHPPAKVSLPSPSLARAALSRFPHVRPLQL
jgi:hypothetical protein